MSADRSDCREARNETEQHLALAAGQLLCAQGSILELMVSDDSIREHTHAERMRLKEGLYLLHDLRKDPVFAWELNTEIYKRSFETKEEILADMCARLGWNYTGPDGSLDSGQDCRARGRKPASEMTIPVRESKPRTGNPELSLGEPSVIEKSLMKARHHLGWALRDMQAALDEDGRNPTDMERSRITDVAHQVEGILRSLT